MVVSVLLVLLSMQSHCIEWHSNREQAAMFVCYRQMAQKDCPQVH